MSQKPLTNDQGWHKGCDAFLQVEQVTRWVC